MYNSKIKALLGVLDMPEEKQVEFFYIKGHRQLVDTFPAGGLRIKYGKNNEIIEVKHSQSKLRFDRSALADLAFRLRDEVKTKHEKEWYQACFIVSEKLFNPAGGREFKEYRGSEAEHDILQGKAIWWIIAALIAKELARKELENG